MKVGVCVRLADAFSLQVLCHSKRNEEITEVRDTNFEYFNIMK